MRHRHCTKCWCQSRLIVLPIIFEVCIPFTSVMGYHTTRVEKKEMRKSLSIQIHEHIRTIENDYLRILRTPALILETLVMIFLPPIFVQVRHIPPYMNQKETNNETKNSYYKIYI